MQCPQCKHQNSTTAQFCEECGTRLARTCRACGQEVSRRARYRRLYTADLQEAKALLDELT
jgi:hypothetical protein